MLAESRTRLADLYGGRASVRAVVGEASASQLDIHIALPLEFVHAD
jgi:hypothetical protein